MTSRFAGTATIFVSCMAKLLIGVDLTVLHLAVPALSRELNASPEQALWIADIYGFAMGGLLVTMGNLGDRFGRRRVLVCGSVVFAASSVVAAYAPTAELLIVARALMGVAGSAMLPSTTSLLRAVFTTQRARAAAVGANAAVSAAGFAVGPIVGGVLLDNFWWGSVFLVNVPVIGLILLAIPYVPESRMPGQWRLELISVLQSIVGVVALVYAIKETFEKGLWHPGVLGALVLGLVTMVLFVRRQLRLTVPLIDLSLFQNRAFTASIGSNLIAVFTMSAFMLINSQYFQLVREWTPLISGLAFVPVALASLLSGGWLAAKAVTRFGRAPVVAIGLGLGAVGFAVFALVEADSLYLLVAVAQVAFGVGAGLTLTVTGDTILGTSPRDRAGAAAAMSSTAYELGGSLGIAVLGSVVAGVYRAEITVPAGVPEPMAEQVRESITAALAPGLPEPVAAAVRIAASEAFVDGIRVSMIVSAGVMGVLALVALRALRGVPKVIERDVIEDQETVRIDTFALFAPPSLQDLPRIAEAKTVRIDMRAEQDTVRIDMRAEEETMRIDMRGEQDTVPIDMRSMRPRGDG